MSDLFTSYSRKPQQNKFFLEITDKINIKFCRDYPDTATIAIQQDKTNNWSTSKICNKTSKFSQQSESQFKAENIEAVKAQVFKYMDSAFFERQLDLPLWLKETDKKALEYKITDAIRFDIDHENKQNLHDVLSYKVSHYKTITPFCNGREITNDVFSETSYAEHSYNAIPNAIEKIKSVMTEHGVGSGYSEWLADLYGQQMYDS